MTDLIKAWERLKAAFTLLLETFHEIGNLIKRKVKRK